MRVLLLSHGSGPYGAERVLLELARMLAARGHEVVLSFPHPGPAAEAAAMLPGVRVRIGGRRRLPRNLREGMAWLVGGLSDILEVRRLVAQTAPDVTWVNSMYSPWAAVGARLAGRPVVWHLHERSMRGLPGAMVAALVGWTADRVVAVSGYAAESYRRLPFLRRTVGVLSNPLFTDFGPRPSEPTDHFTVGYVGQLEPRKRVTDLVRALALLPEDVRGDIVGDGKDRSTVAAAVRKAGLEQRVRLLGYRADVPEWLARFHCLAVPSPEEAFGLAGLEAMAIGVPVIAARSGALTEVLGDAALYHAPGDAAGLAKQIDRLRVDPLLRRALAARGLERAARFAPEAWIESVEEILSAAAAAPGRQGRVPA